VKLDASGITFTDADDGLTAVQLKWMSDSGPTLATIYPTLVSMEGTLNISATPIGPGSRGTTIINATAYGQTPKEFSFNWDDGLTAGADLRVGGGLYVGGTGTDPDDNDIWLDGDIRALGGLYVGSLGTDPAADWIYADGGMYINDTSNANQTLGLTINQGAADDEILALKSSDVAHGMTTKAETDTYGTFAKISATEGGLSIVGYGEAVRGLGLVGRAVTDDTRKTTAGLGYVVINAQKKSSTDVGAAGSNANLMVIRTHTTARFIFDAEGSAHADVEWTTFDDYDDVALLTDLERALLAQKDPIKSEFVDFLQYNHDALEQAGLVHFDRDNPGHAMVNTTKLSMALVGALRQIHGRMDRLEKAITG
jgi:hypothetical protein